ncbi:UPF0496 protein At3g49070 [Linum perenne]
MFVDHKGDLRVSDHDKGLNLNDEYHRTLRTQSYVEFSTKAQTLANHHNSPSLASFHHEPLLLHLLEPDQGSIRSVLESSTIVISEFPELKPVFVDYFDSTAGSSRLCTHLLAHIARIAHPKFVHQVFDEMSETESCISELMNFLVSESSNSFSSIEDLIDGIRNQYSSVLEELKSRRRKVKRKIKVIGCINRVAGISVAAACGVLALTAVVLAAHTFTALVMGPMAVVGGGIGPVKKLVNRVLRFKVMTSIGVLKRVHRQLDVAAKCMYILNRDMETVSRLVTRLHDEVEHGKEMTKFWSEKMSKSRDNATTFKAQVAKEMKRKDCELRKQVDELEELLCLCLLTINRGRGLVAHELTR